MQTPWAVILCKFTDGNDEPHTQEYYEDLFTVRGIGSSWNMARYFSDYTHGTLDLRGTEVFGWFQLDKSVADYNTLGGRARDELITWARDAAVTCGIDLKLFYSVVVCTNRSQDVGAARSLRGVVAQGSLAQIAGLLGHEMGLVYGMKSSRPSGLNDDREFTRIAAGLNAANMRARGWLDESRVWKPAAGRFDETVTLRPLVRRDLPGFLAAETPSGFLLEFRVQTGWDSAIPRPAVFVHRFDGGHCCPMRGNSGSPDLVAGDSFGDADPGPGTDPCSKFERVEVQSIDTATAQATLRLRYHRADQWEPGVDPMSLILPRDAYLLWVRQHHPHETKVARMEKVFRTLTFRERDAALNRARLFVEYGQAVEWAIAGIT